MKSEGRADNVQDTERLSKAVTPMRPSDSGTRKVLTRALRVCKEKTTQDLAVEMRRETMEWTERNSGRRERQGRWKDREEVGGVVLEKNGGKQRKWA